MISFREIFRVVRFSTFATISAPNGHAEAVATCLLLRDQRTFPRRGPRSEFGPKPDMPNGLGRRLRCGKRIGC